MDDTQSPPDAESRKDEHARRASLRLRDAETVATSRRDMFGDGSLLDAFSGGPPAPGRDNPDGAAAPDPAPAMPPDSRAEAAPEADAGGQQPAAAAADGGDDFALPLDAIIDSFPSEPPAPEASLAREPASGHPAAPRFVLQGRNGGATPPEQHPFAAPNQVSAIFAGLGPGAAPEGAAGDAEATPPGAEPLGLGVPEPQYPDYDASRSAVADDPFASEGPPTAARMADPAPPPPMPPLIPPMRDAIPRPPRGDSQVLDLSSWRPMARSMPDLPADMMPGMAAEPHSGPDMMPPLPRARADEPPSVWQTVEASALADPPPVEPPAEPEVQPAAEARAEQAEPARESPPEVPAEFPAEFLAEPAAEPLAAPFAPSADAPVPPTPDRQASPAPYPEPGDWSAPSAARDAPAPAGWADEPPPPVPESLRNSTPAPFPEMPGWPPFPGMPGNEDGDDDGSKPPLLERPPLGEPFDTRAKGTAPFPGAPAWPPYPEAPGGAGAAASGLPPYIELPADPEPPPPPASHVEPPDHDAFAPVSAPDAGRYMSPPEPERYAYGAPGEDEPPFPRSRSQPPFVTSAHEPPPDAWAEPPAPTVYAAHDDAHSGGDATAKIAAEANATAQALDSLQRMLGQAAPAAAAAMQAELAHPQPVRRHARPDPYELRSDPPPYSSHNSLTGMMPMPVAPPPEPASDRSVYLLGFLTGLVLSIVAGAALYFLITTA